MKHDALMESLCLTVPMVATIFCAIICLMYASSQKGELQSRYAMLMTSILLLAALAWAGTLTFLLDSEAFARINSVFLLVLMMNQVQIYRFVYEITTTGREHFRVLHYVVPALITLVVVVWSVFVPFDVQHGIVRDARIDPDYPLTSMLMFCSTVVFCFYNIFYASLGFRRVSYYRRLMADYSADATRSSLRWLHLFVVLVLTTLPLPAVILAMGNRALPEWGATLLCVAFPVFQYTLITYNMIVGNYVVFEQESKEEKQRIVPIDRRKFERYLKTNKPYLNPKLRITDLARELGTNRTYLSTFINGEYGMNFSRYINHLRMEHLDALRTSRQGIATTDNMSAILEAGFGSYRSYLRIKQEEDRSRLIKVF